MKQLILVCTLIGMIFFSHTMASSQTITSKNFQELFKKVGTDISNENYENATELSYQLIEYINGNQSIRRDSSYVYLTKIYYNLTNIYLWNEFDLSIKYADSTIAMAIKTNSPATMQSAYSIKYYALYDVKGEETTLDFLADKCIFYALEANNDKMLGESYMHKCNAQVELGRIKEAASYCDLAVKSFEKVSDESFLTSVYNNIGNVFNKSGAYQRALSYYLKSHELALKNNDGRNVAMSARNLAEQNEKLNDFKKASAYYKVYGDSIESHYLKLVETSFTEAEAKYQSQLKDKEIAEQQLEIVKQKNTRNTWIFGSIAFLLIAVGGFQYLNFRQKRKKIAVEAALQKEQDVNELRSKFLGNIAHEIRTPLTLISGNLNLALENFSNKEKAQKNIKVALENSKKVTDDANEILALLKFEKNKTTLNMETTNLDDTLRRMVLSFKSLADMKRLTLTYESTIPATYTTALDIEKTERIINNLISNAIKHSPSNTTIIVQTEVANEVLHVKVIDQGEGIHYNEIEKIFERFYQATSSKAIGGIGIGLSLSREFALLLGGDLTASSELHSGSTFTLQLPVPKVDRTIIASEEIQEADTEKYTETTTEKKKFSEKPKILIAEDNPQMASYLEEILSPNYHCTLAFDGAEALQKVKNETFDLITSDIMMPQMDGFEFRASINQIAEAKSIPFILISAKTLEEDKIKGFNLGIDDYIVKPFSKNELLARVENLLIHQESRKKYQLQNQDILEDTKSSDQKLVKEMEAIVLQNIGDERFKVPQLAERVHYSQRQLTRIVKQYTGMTPVQFILEIRLQKAYQLLQHRTFFTLSEVRYDVGISSSPYFNKTFKARFGINPSELLA